jgi:hypothetical protein
MAQTLQNFADALKHFYTPVIREQLNNANVLWKKLSRSQDGMVGDEVYMVLHTGMNEGIGARAELEDLPSAGQQAYKQVHFPLKYNYARIQVSGQVIRQSRDNTGAYASALKSEVQGAIGDLTRDLNRQVYGDGTGKLCGVTAAIESKDQAVDDIKFLRVGMKLDLMKADNTVITAGIVITAVNTATKVVSFDTAITPTEGSYLVRTGSYGREITGLAKIIADGNTYLDIDRTVGANSYWRSVVDTAEANRAITELLLQTALDNVDLNGGKTNLMITTHGIRRAYQTLLTSQKRFVNTMDLEGGFKALEYNGLPMVPDKDCPTGTILGLDTSRLKFYNTGDDFSWMDKDGAMLNRVPNKDAYEATLIHYVELCSDRPAAMFKIDHITEA